MLDGVLLISSRFSPVGIDYLNANVYPSSDLSFWPKKNLSIETFRCVHNTGIHHFKNGNKEFF